MHTPEARQSFARDCRERAPRNRQWRLARRPAEGEPTSADLFTFADAPIPVPGPGQLLVRTLLLGTSPAQRAYTTSGVSMHAKVQIGEVMRGRGMGIVVESRHDRFRAGDIVNASLGWQDWAVVEPGDPRGGIFDVQAIEQPRFPLSVHLGILGNAAHTAYFGLLRVGELKPGQRVLVSAAAGGVGSIVGQVARNMGCHVVGIAGSADKCRWLREYVGYDATIDYRAEAVGERIAGLFPQGIDVFFDNVGGEILDAGLRHLALGARVVICGFISTDYGSGRQYGPANYTWLVRRRARMEGFFVQDFASHMAEADAQLRTWHAQGLLKPVEDVVPGLEHMPDCLASLFSGGNRGVRMCAVDAYEEGAP